MHMTHRLHEIVDAVPTDALKARRLSTGAAATVIIALSGLLWGGLLNLVWLIAAYHA